MVAAAKSKPKIMLTAMGHYHPENEIRSSFFDKLNIGSDGEWIIERTGIQSRRSVLTEEDILALRHRDTTLSKLRADGRVMSIADMSQPAWEVLKARLNNPALESELDVLICGSSVPDYDIPANACTIAAKVGTNAISFDVNSACSAFVVDLNVAAGLLTSGPHKKIGIFNPERYSLRMDYSDRRNSVLFGDGCSCCLVEAVDDASAEDIAGFELIDTILVSDPSKYHFVHIKDGEDFDQDGKAVQKFAISKTMQTTQMILEKNNYSPDDVAYIIGHQANLRMVESAVARLGIATSKHLYNVDRLGNQGAAGAPCVLSENWDKFKKDDIVVVTVVGSGLTWGSALLKKC